MDCSKYLDELVHPVIDDMIERLIKTKPDDPIPIILEVLEKHNGRESVPLTTKEELELKDLQKRWKELKSKPIETKEEVKITVSPSKPSEKEELKFSKSLPRGGLKRAPPTDSDSDTDDTETFSRSALLKVKPQSKKPPRASVSAEVMGLFNSRAKVKHVVVPKDEATRQKIKLRLKDSFTTKNLDDKDIDVVVDAIKEVHFKDGDYIIKQGDDGNEFYILESGECECYKLFPGDEVAKKLRDYVPGESFGELALLYNAPRAATIKAVEDVTLWSLDRQTFNMIVKDASRKNREMYEEFLKSVELLSSMDYYELVSLSDALKKEKYKAGDFIIKEGEIGD